MSLDDLEGDVRLRKSAHASLARAEAEVDSEAAWLEFRDRLTEAPFLKARRVSPRPLVRRYVAVAVLLLLVAGAATALIRWDGGSRSATVVPSPTGTDVEQRETDGSLPNDTSTAGPVASTIEVSSQAPAELVALFGRTWVITRANGRPRAFAAYFEMSSGKAVGHDGCNFFDSTIQLESIADGASSMRVTGGGSTSAPCVPPYNEGWPAPSGRYRVDGDFLTITADDGTTLDAVDLDSLPLVRSADQIIGQWTVPDGPDIKFADDGTIRLPCATIGTWTAGASVQTTIDQTEAATNCPIAELRSLSWTYDDLLAGSPTIRRLADGSLLIGSSQLGRLVRPSALNGPETQTADGIDSTPSPSHFTGYQIGDRIDPTEAPVIPPPEWVAVGRDNSIIGYERNDPTLPTVRPDEIDINSHPDLLIYDDERAIIGTFFEGLPVLWNDTSITQPNTAFDLVNHCGERAVELDGQWWNEGTPATGIAVSRLGSGIVRYINATTAVFIGDDQTIAGLGRLAMVIHPADTSTDPSDCP